MDFKYYIEEIGVGSINFMMEPNEQTVGYIHNVGGWLRCDVQGCGEDYLPKVKKVLEGEVEEEEFWGNAYKVVVHKDLTKISYDYEEDNPKMVHCTLPTEMLYEILEIWIKAYEEHQNKQN